MEHELQKSATVTARPRPLPTKRLTGLPTVDIYCIGSVGFARNLKQLDSTAFVTSLYEIDQIIEEKEIEAIRAKAAEDERSNEALITQQLPA